MIYAIIFMVSFVGGLIGMSVFLTTKTGERLVDWLSDL